MTAASERSRVSLFVAPAAVALVVAAIALQSGVGQRPVAREWLPVGDLAVARAYASATVLADGSVLVVGGLDGDARDHTITRSELFEPLAAASVPLSQDVLGRIHHTATRTGDLVVVTGGVELRGKDWVALDRTDVFDARTRTWRTAGALAQARSDARATALKDGRVLVAGGNDGPHMLTSVELFDPKIDQWRTAAPLPSPRTQFTIATLPDGRVLVAGGLEAPGLPSASSALYDAASDSWTPGPSLAIERVLHADAQLPSGAVLLIGGQNAAGGSVEIYDPRANAFAFFGTLVETRMLAQAVALPDGSVLVTGGLSPQRDAADFSPRATAERYDPGRRAFEPIAAPADARAFAKLAVLGGDVYQIGGVGRGERGVKTVEALGWR